MIYWLTKETLQPKSSLFYAEINGTKIIRSILFWKNLKRCAALSSNLRKQRPKFDVTDAAFEFEFPEDLHWKIKKEQDNHG